MDFKKLISRLKEPSTYAGLAGVAVILGVSMEDFNNYALAVAGACSFIAIFLQEKQS